jgi:hypothetical protein
MVERDSGSDDQSRRDERYNGWKNYQTWCVNLWLENREEVLWRFQRLADEDAEATELANSIQAYFEALNPLEDEPSAFNDLLTNALQQVDWVEIARSLSQDS